MQIGRVKITWSSIGKIAAGIAAVALSFTIFKSAPGWVKVLALAALVLILLAPPLLMRKKLPPDIEKALKDDDRRSGYG